MDAVLGVAVRSMAPAVLASGPVLVAMLTLTCGRLLDVDHRTAGVHWDGLCHPGLSLDVGWLRVRSAALVEGCLVGIVAGSDDWDPLHIAGVLLRVAGWAMERG